MGLDGDPDTGARHESELFRGRERQARGPLESNGGDPDPPSTLEICRAIGNALEYEFEPVLLPAGEFGNPWAVPSSSPLVVSMEAAERELGYRPVTAYPEAVKETCAWLVDELERGRSWEGTYIEESLDYAAEDEVLAAQS